MRKAVEKAGGAKVGQNGRTNQSFVEEWKGTDGFFPNIVQGTPFHGSLEHSEQRRAKNQR